MKISVANVQAIHDNEDITRLLNYATTQLLTGKIPMPSGVFAYLRICCTALGKLQNAFSGLATPHGKEPTPERTYSELLTALCQHQSEWWQHCWVSDRGILQSNDPAIATLLQPLADFIEFYTGPSPKRDDMTMSVSRQRPSNGFASRPILAIL